MVMTAKITVDVVLNSTSKPLVDNFSRNTLIIPKVVWIGRGAGVSVRIVEML